jgi:CheY-like chemotaxis protein
MRIACRCANAFGTVVAMRKASQVFRKYGPPLMLTPTTITAVQSAGRTILIVDDVADARDMLARLLRLDGHDTRTAEDGATALASVESDPPDLMLLDVTMPDMDGLEVLRRLRDRPGGARGMPVVMFSAVPDPRLADEARRLGAVDYVVKGSVDACGLLDRLARHLTAAAKLGCHA